MDGPRGHYAKLRERKKGITCFHLYVESKNKIKKTNITKQKQTHRHKEQADSFQRVGMSEKDEGVEEVQSSSYKMNKKQGHDVHHGEYGQNYSNNFV